MGGGDKGKIHTDALTYWFSVRCISDSSSLSTRLSVNKENPSTNTDPFNFLFVSEPLGLGRRDQSELMEPGLKLPVTRLSSTCFSSVLFSTSSSLFHTHLPPFISSSFSEYSIFLLLCPITCVSAFVFYVFGSSSSS